MVRLGELAGTGVPPACEVTPPTEPDTPAAVDADAAAVFGWREDCRPQERAHAYLEARGVDRLGGDTALLAVVRDLCRRSEDIGRQGASGDLSGAISRALDVVELLRRAGR